MTDGIIQKIFDKWEFKENEFYQDVIDSIKKELIEKIKQIEPEAKMTRSDRNKPIELIDKETLIGDNQE